MERVYVRLAPGTSLEDAVAADQRDGRDARRASCRKGTVELVLTNVGSPQQRAQRDDQPERGPAHGLHPPRARRPREAQAVASARSPTRSREILNRDYPGRRVPAVAGRPRRQRLRQRLHRAAGRRGARRQPGGARRAGEGGRRGRAHGARASATSTRRCRSTTRRSASTPTATKAGLVGVTARDAAQTTLEATLGNINTPSVWIDPNNGQSYYVVTYYDGAGGRRPERARAASRCASATTGRPVTLGAYGDVRRSVGPIAVERNQLQRAAHVLMQTEGRDIGSVAARARAGAASRPAHARRQLRLRRAGRS